MTLCGTCGDSGMVCCGQYLGTGECCAALNGGAAMEPCPDCTVSGRRDVHEAFDNGDLDLLPYLIPARHPDAYARELVHALEHADYSLTRLLHRLTGERHLPESEIDRLVQARLAA